MSRVTRIKTTTPSPYPLTAILADTYDTKTFRFGFPADATVDMLPADHLYLHAMINGKTVTRPFTPEPRLSPRICSNEIRVLTRSPV